MKFVATYTNGRDIKRKSFPADSRAEAYETALRRTSAGYKLFNLRISNKEKKSSEQATA